MVNKDLFQNLIDYRINHYHFIFIEIPEELTNKFREELTAYVRKHHGSINYEEFENIHNKKLIRKDVIDLNNRLSSFGGDAIYAAYRRSE